MEVTQEIYPYGISIGPHSETNLGKILKALYSAAQVEIREGAKKQHISLSLIKYINEEQKKSNPKTFSDTFKSINKCQMKGYVLDTLFIPLQNFSDRSCSIFIKRKKGTVYELYIEIESADPDQCNKCRDCDNLIYHKILVKKLTSKS